MLDGGRSLEPAQPRHADAAGPADAPEVVAQDVHDHHVLGAVLGARQQLAGERPVAGGVAAARAGALDRIRGHDAVPVDGEERLGRRRQERPRPAGQRARTEVDERREQRRVAGPQPPVEVPRVAVERRLEPAGEVGLVQVAIGDVLADALDARHVGAPVETRAERQAVARPGTGRAGCSGRAGEPGMDLVETPRQPPIVAIERRARRAMPSRSAGPRRRPSRGARAGAVAGPGRWRRSRAAARRSPPGRSRGSRPARRATVVRRRATRPGRGARRGARATANGSGPPAGVSMTATGSAVRYDQRALRPGRALSNRTRPGRSRNDSATSIARAAAIRSGRRRRRGWALDRSVGITGR